LSELLYYDMADDFYADYIVGHYPAEVIDLSIDHPDIAAPVYGYCANCEAFTYDSDPARVQCGFTADGRPRFKSEPRELCFLCDGPLVAYAPGGSLGNGALVTDILSDREPEPSPTPTTEVS